MLEVGLDTIALDAQVPDQEALDSGAPNQVHCQVVGGSELPFAAPGHQRPMKFPSIAVNFSLTKEAALRYAELLIEKANTLPDEKHSDILTAQSLHGVEELAKANDRFRG